MRRGRMLAMSVSAGLGVAGCGAGTPLATPPAVKSVALQHVLVELDEAGRARLARVPGRRDAVLTIAGSGIARAKTLGPDQTQQAKELLRILYRRKGKLPPLPGPNAVEFRFVWKGGAETLAYSLDPSSPYALQLGNLLTEYGVRRAHRGADR